MTQHSIVYHGMPGHEMTRLLKYSTLKSHMNETLIQKAWQAAIDQM